MDFSSDEIQLIKDVFNDLKFYDELCPELKSKIYEFFLSTGEFPIGIAKGRTGDPEEWIIERLDWIFE